MAYADRVACDRTAAVKKNSHRTKRMNEACAGVSRFGPDGLRSGAFLFLPSAGTLSRTRRLRALWRAEENLPRSLPELEELAEREYGVGWQARVLASRAFLPQADYKDGARYLAAALELRSIEQLRAELALTLEAAGNRTEALREWEKLLPADDAVQARHPPRGRSRTGSAAARRSGTLHGGAHRPGTAMRRRQASMWRCVRYCGPMWDWWEADEADSARRAKLDGATSSLYVNSNFTVGIEGR